MNIQELAVIMNMPESSVRSFVNCLRVWTDKGLSIHEAIIKHQQVIDRMRANPQASFDMVMESI
jgi:hypothetical protein